MRLRVVTWNLMHGRSVPGAGRNLLGDFAGALAGWEWDVALLQEVPPWWPRALSERLGCEQRTVLTSRNALLALRRAIAERQPDLIKSNGGGANAILVRCDRIADHRALQLCRWPERRWMHAVQLGAGVWLANLHATAGNEPRAVRDGGRAAISTCARRPGTASREWAGATWTTCSWRTRDPTARPRCSTAESSPIIPPWRQRS
jgi:endonuclease/exonuclease/phosphatase family metal-dependent hydrolase